jgi:hypothetical protein
LVVVPSREEMDWGKRFLAGFAGGLRPDGLTVPQRARAIQREASRTWKYRIRSPRTVGEIVAGRGGNCVSHAIMGLFLLRLSGIPARLCYEFHIRNHSAVDGWRAARERAGHYSAHHNSHFWVMFDDGSQWQPYDSALGLAGFEEFYAVRTRTQRWPYALSLNPRRMTGAPFIIELETGAGRPATVNATTEIWNREFSWANEKVSRDEWMRFVRQFDNQGTEDFAFPLAEPTAAALAAMSRKWF